MDKINKVLILSKIKEYKNFRTDAEFARFLGVKAQTLANWVRRNTFDEVILIEAFPELDIRWLLTGQGEMFVNNLTSGEAPVTNVALLPISAQGGSLNDFVASLRNEDCEQIISPIKGVDFAMTVAGDSMAPEYPSGSQILVKKIDSSAFIEWGKVYVLDTCNGSVIKKIMPSQQDDRVKCCSINLDYPEFEVDKKDIFGMYKVLLNMSIK